MAKADYEEAKRAMKMLPDGPFSGPSYLFLIGRAWYELGQIDKAAPLIEQAAKADPHERRRAVLPGPRARRAGRRRAARPRRSCARARSTSTRGPAGVGAEPRDVRRRRARRRSRSSTWCSRATCARPRCTSSTCRAPSSSSTASTRARCWCSTRRPSRTERPPRVRVFVYQRNVERAAGALEAMETRARRGPRARGDGGLPRRPEARQEPAELNHGS